MEWHSKQNAGRKFIKSHNIWWVKDSAGVVIIDIERKIYWLLVGFENDLWQLMALQYPFEYLVGIAERVLGVSRETSREIVSKHIDHWVSEGILRNCEQ
jgi:hypothetical protein